MKTIKLLLLAAEVLWFIGCHKDKIKEREEIAVETVVMADGLTWTAKNLDMIPTGFEKETWWYDNDQETYGLYGRLYTWEAAQAACKALGGKWRLPIGSEWYALASMEGDWVRDQWGYEFNHLAYQNLLSVPDDENAVENNFNAHLGGWFSPYHLFTGLGQDGFYWSASEHQAGQGWHLQFFRGQGLLFLGWSDKANGYSCRCVKNA